ncbi:helix-turn-helix domain-containing protein [Bradyrhizobium iriomotense]|uniref:helix-turn-helix domain-containing protein n=1 Tax=Bradyrhizobium iriomotense TaxID=441950 RepID=UPI001B8A481E|nr:AraC family transcriptional regulator [Bradyrhizobium iriomotense]MBR0781983.1 helix-turn-helix transcriptional regulator [Bradyrhizobium iriomotense]
MDTGTRNVRASIGVEADLGAQSRERGDIGAVQQQKWQDPARLVRRTNEHISISRRLDLRSTARSEESVTPPDQYFIGVALRPIRLKLTRERQSVFDGTMRAGAAYVQAPSSHLSAQLHAPCDFLHLRVCSVEFRAWRSLARPSSASEDEVVLLYDPFAAQLARILIGRGDAAEEGFVRCVGQALAMHLARVEVPRSRVGALPRWRLRRVEDYVKAHFERHINLIDLASAAGLSRMHFAAQFRVATGYRPCEYVLHHRIERAKSLLSGSEMPLVEVALAAGFCTQAHFSTVFKRMVGETPARWRSEMKQSPQRMEL